MKMTRTYDNAGMSMKALDRILELLQDSQPHSLGEIKVQIALSAEKLALILDFLAEHDFIELRDENSEATITPLGLSFLELPSETLSA
jgi:predicted transcriptional regulator